MKKEFTKLCNEFSLAAFILFGSTAVGKANKLSDVDIAHLPARALSPEKENDLFLKVARLLKRDDVDLVDLTKAGLTLKYSILNSGKVIACTDKRRLYDFVVKTRSDYLDTAFLRMLAAHYMDKRIRAGKFGR